MSQTDMLHMCNNNNNNNHNHNHLYLKSKIHVPKCFTETVNRQPSDERVQGADACLWSPGEEAGVQCTGITAALQPHSRPRNMSDSEQAQEYE